MDVSGVFYSFAPRITIDFETAKPAMEAWARRCQRMAVFQHVKDQTVSSTHIHVLMLGCNVKEEALKREFKKCLPGVDVGNKFWAWEHKKYGTPDDHFLTYMSKGVLRPVLVKNFPDELVEERRQQWKVTTPKAVESSQKSDMYDDLEKAFFAEVAESEYKNMRFESVRFWVFHWCYRKTNKVPHATQYKQLAGSLYMKVGQKSKRFSEASQEVFSLWY